MRSKGRGVTDAESRPSANLLPPTRALAARSLTRSHVMIGYVACCLTPLFLCIGLPVRWLLKQEWPQLRRMLYFPIAGQARWEHRTQRQRLLHLLGGKELLSAVRVEGVRSW